MTQQTIVDIRQRSLQDLLAENVRQGAALLERELGPYWFATIDRDKLRMESAQCCVLGQTFAEAGYFQAVERFSGFTPDEPGHRAWAVAHGFNVSEYDTSFGLLGDLWKEEFVQAAKRITEPYGVIRGGVA